MKFLVGAGSNPQPAILLVSGLSGESKMPFHQRYSTEGLRNPKQAWAGGGSAEARGSNPQLSTNFHLAYRIDLSFLFFFHALRNNNLCSIPIFILRQGQIFPVSESIIAKQPPVLEWIEPLCPHSQIIFQLFFFPHDVHLPNSK